MKKERKKRVKAGLIGLLLLSMLMQIGVQAAVDNTVVSEVVSDTWKKWPKAPEISSASAVVMDASTGVVVYDKGGQEERYPASAVKLMTLLIAVENGSLDQPVVFTETSQREIGADTKNIGMKVGEEMPLRDCLYAMMLYSANEVSTQIAESVGGSEAYFIDGMNQKAAQLGCLHTYFTNATGLPDEEQYSCAYDLALILRANLENSTCREILSCQEYTIQPTNMNPEARVLTCTQPLLAQTDANHYEGCLAEMSGETEASGRVMVTAAEREGNTYIAATMYSKEGAAVPSEHTGLLDYAFSEFVRVFEKGGSFLIPVKTRKRAVSETDYVLMKKNDLGITLPSEYAASPTADIKVFYYDGVYVGLGEAPEATPTPTVTPQPTATPEPTSTPVPQNVIEQLKQEGLSRTAVILLEVMGGMAVLIVILLILLAVKNHRRRNR